MANDGTPIVGQKPREWYAPDEAHPHTITLIKALSERQGMTRNQKKSLNDATQAAYRNHLLEQGLPNIAARVGVDLFTSNFAPLIEIDTQKQIMEQEFGKQQQKTVTQSGELTIFLFLLNIQKIMLYFLNTMF